MFVSNHLLITAFVTSCEVQLAIDLIDLIIHINRLLLQIFLQSTRVLSQPIISGLFAIITITVTSTWLILSCQRNQTITSSVRQFNNLRATFIWRSNLWLIQVVAFRLFTFRAATPLFNIVATNTTPLTLPYIQSICVECYSITALVSHNSSSIWRMLTTPRTQSGPVGMSQTHLPSLQQSIPNIFNQEESEEGHICGNCAAFKRKAIAWRRRLWHARCGCRSAPSSWHQFPGPAFGTASQDLRTCVREPQIHWIEGHTDQSVQARLVQVA